MPGFLAQICNKYLNFRLSSGLVITLVCLTLTLQACSSPALTPTAASPTVTPTVTPQPAPTVNLTQKVAPPDDWQTRWLKGIPCRPPCWEGVTPGVTKLTEALQLLQKNPIVAAAQINSGSNGNSYLGWDWANIPKPSAAPVGYGGTASVKKTASDAIINVVSPSLTLEFELGELIKAYGEPTHVLANASLGDAGVIYSIHFIYMTQGFEIRGFNDRKPESINFQSKVSMPVFFVPGLEGYQEAFPVPNLKFLVEWKGFQNFAFYCRYTNFGGVKIPDCTQL